MDVTTRRRRSSRWTREERALWIAMHERIAAATAPFDERSREVAALQRALGADMEAALQPAIADSIAALDAYHARHDAELDRRYSRDAARKARQAA